MHRQAIDRRYKVSLKSQLIFQNQYAVQFIFIITTLYCLLHHFGHINNISLVVDGLYQQTVGRHRKKHEPIF
jgi:hypothetical protein